MKLLFGISGLLLLLTTFSFTFGSSKPVKENRTLMSFARPADTLRVDSMVFADFFSPNGDGENDFFIVQGIELYPDNVFKVFNRWGQQVYGASPYINDWDGTNNQPSVVGDKALSEGVYFFELKSGTGYTAYGKITLKR